MIGPASNIRIFLSSYASGSIFGRNLGSGGYSYDFVAKVFRPLLERYGEVVVVDRPERILEAEAECALREDKVPVHMCFRAIQDAVFSSKTVNVVVPAWEFPDVPDHAFDNNPANDWVRRSRDCDAVIVGGPFTKATFERGGMKTPIHIVPVPISDRYFQLAPWDERQRVKFECSGYGFPQAADRTLANVSTSLLARLRNWASHGKAFYRDSIRPRIPETLDLLFTGACYTLRTMLKKSLSLYRRSTDLELSGVVYTSIFNPGDGRKNWEDLLTAFLQAFRDRDDATLVMKLVSSNRYSINRVFDFYRELNLEHRCRVVVITDFLSDAQMLKLCEASTYYVNTARAEGNCLPLMDYLAAGRPGIAPPHTAMSDYFSSDIGFAIESDAEPAAWPQDRRQRWRTTWQRLVWPSLVEQLQESYWVARHDARRYQALAERARAKMWSWASGDAVWPRLKDALSTILTEGGSEPKRWKLAA